MDTRLHGCDGKLASPLTNLATLRYTASLMKPAVSVLLPVYNAAGTLPDAVRSLLGQTLLNLEVVAVDDGSTDGSSDILASLAGEDPRVRVIRTENRGVLQALNTGLAHCRADLIARMDADDLCHPRRLDLQSDWMQGHPETSVLSCRVEMFPRDGLLGGMLRYEEWLNGFTDHEDIVRNFFVESPFAHPTVMLRRAEVVEMGGYQEHGWPEDYDLWLRYLVRGCRFAKLPQTLLAWRHTPQRLTFSDSRYSLENFLRAKAHYLATLLAGQNRPVWLWGAGQMGRRLLKHLLREEVPIEAIVDIDPRKIGTVRRGIPVVPRPALIGKDVFVIGAVGSVGARGLIRDCLTGIGRTEVRDFLMAA